MANMTDQEAKREYLKILLGKIDRVASSLISSTSYFFTFTLAFFVLLQFHPSELSLFGAKVNIPQNWIIAIAPLVLSFYYLRVVSLYDTLDEYEHEIDLIAPEAIIGENWKLEKNRLAAITESVFWFKRIPMSQWRNRGCLYDFINLCISGVVLLSVFFIPVPIIGYFVWQVWQSQVLYFSIIISTVSIIITLLSVMMVIIQIKTEMR